VSDSITHILYLKSRATKRLFCTWGRKTAGSATNCSENFSTVLNSSLVFENYLALIHAWI